MKRRIALALVVAAVLAPTAAHAADPPLATTGAATSVGVDVGALNGTVNPNGAAVAACRFEYGTTAAYGAEAACLPASLGAGTFNVSVNAQLEDLEPGTEYHFRLVAASANGATSGLDRTFVTTGTPICPNAARRLEQGIVAIQLPDCMALEQVSPSQKFNQRAVAPTISADGTRIAFKGLAALADTPGLLSTFYGDFYVASLGTEGWITSPTSPPPPITKGWEALFARSFDPTLSRWVVMGSSVENAQYDSGISGLFRGRLDGSFQQHSSLLTPLDGGVHGYPNVAESQLQGASADHSYLFFAMGDSSATYLAGDPVPSGVGNKNVYIARPEAGQPSIELLSRDKAGKAWGGTCGSRLGGIGGVGVGWRNQGAISPDGARVYFSTRAAQPEAGVCSETNKLRILVRTETALGPEISHLIPGEGVGECAPLCSGVDGDDFYQGASVDGSKVYFTSNRQLADTDLDTGTACSGSSGAIGCDLYLYDGERDEGERLVQVSAGETGALHPVVGEGANVFNGTVAISGDGSRVYFAAAGVLTTSSNPAGKTAAEYPATDPKLYTWDTASEAVHFIGALSAADGGLWGANGTFLNSAYPVPATATSGSGKEIGGDGHVLLFQSKATLTANDVDGARLDSFRYDSGSGSASLLCISCRPGGPDSEPFDVSQLSGESLSTQPGLAGTAFAEWGRWASEDGAAVLVRTSEPLVPGDLDVLQDDYLWRDGGLTLLPGTTPPPGFAAFGERPPVLSHDGSTVAFTGYASLLPSDGDTAPDVYVARMDGGFPIPRPARRCIPGQDCAPPPSAPIGVLEAGSLSFIGRGNVKAQGKGRCSKGKRRVVRSGKARCVKRPTRKRGASKNGVKHNQGGQK